MFLALFEHPVSAAEARRIDGADPESIDISISSAKVRRRFDEPQSRS
jgi:hypothetical protein